MSMAAMYAQCNVFEVGQIGGVVQLLRMYLFHLSSVVLAHHCHGCNQLHRWIPDLQGADHLSHIPSAYHRAQWKNLSQTLLVTGGHQ